MEEDKQALLSSEELNEKHDQTGEIKIYKARWLMLFLFSLTTFLNASMFMGLSPVLKIVAPVYGVDDLSVEWLSNMFMVVFVFVSLPSAYIMSRFGVRAVLTTAALCDAIATIFKYGGAHKGKFQLEIAGQFFGALAYSNMLQIPGRLSAVWFPLHERGIATSIGVFMNVIGLAIGFAQPSLMIPASNDPQTVFAALRIFFLTRLVFAFITFVATAFFYRENPPTPASFFGDDKPELGFLESLKVLVKDKDFMLMAQAYGINFGLFVGIAIVLTPLVTWQHGINSEVEHFIGWMGFSCYVAAIVSCFLIGLYLDRSSQHKRVAIVLNAGSFILWLGFALVLTRTTSLLGLFAVFTVYGIFGIPYFASGIEQAAEMTSPVPEGTSSSVILLLGNLYGFVLIFMLGTLIEYNYPLTSLSIILGLYMLSTTFVCLARTELKRSKEESIKRSSMSRLDNDPIVEEEEEEVTVETDKLLEDKKDINTGDKEAMNVFTAKDVN